MEEINKILIKVPFGTLTTVGIDGLAKATPLHFANDDENIYWFSSGVSGHSQNISRNPHVNFAVYTNDHLPNLQGVVIDNVARTSSSKIDLAKAKKAFEEKFHGIPEVFMKYKLYILPLGGIYNEKTSGTKFYLKGEK